MDGLKITNSGYVINRQSDNGLKIDSEFHQKDVLPQNEIGGDFSETLNQAINKVNEAQKVADKKMQELAVGEAKSLPDVMIAAEKAEIALKTMVQVRNKIIDAYQEVMRMQV